MDRIRLLIALARPAVVVLFGLFAATGLAQAGHANDGVLFAKAFAVVIAFLLFAVAVNDLADQAIDRVNLPDDPGRPLVTNTGMHAQMVAVAGASAVIALGASLTLHGPAVLVVAAGLLLAAAYSLPPFRISSRGVIAPMLLPLGYVAVPYLVGLFAVRGSVGGSDLLVLAGLYAGFIGRIVLKDFRDVRGDALFGKRTFLVRHGRGPTCVLSALFWVAGASVLLAVRDRTVALTLSYLAFVLLTLGLLRVLSRSTNARRDEALISAIAIVGRGVVVTVFAHFAMTAAHWTMAAYTVVMAAMVLQFLGAALRMARVGPRSRTVLHAPVDIVERVAAAPGVAPALIAR